MLNNSKNQLKQKIHIVKCNFSSPSKSLEDNQNLKENLKNNKINFLNLWIGDLIKIISFNGEWCFGYRLEEPEKRGIFPSIFVQEMINNNVEENKNVAEKEVGRLAGDISEALKEWIERTKFDYGEGISTICQFEQQISLIKQLLAVKRHLCSGTITAEEIKEIKLVLADVIDAGNHLLKLNMQIRDDSGIYANSDDFSLISSYKRHEQIYEQITTNSKQIIDSFLEDKFLTKISTKLNNINNLNKFSLLININLNELEQHLNNEEINSLELVFGLGKTSKINKNIGNKATQPITEPFTIRLPKITNKNKQQQKQKQQNKVLFIGISETDLENISLWMTCLIIGPIGFYARGGDDVRQYYAHGHSELGELIKEMVDKEQREQTLILQKKTSELVLPSTFQNNPSTINYNNNTIKNEKIPIKLNIQLFNAYNSLITSSTNIQILRPLKLEKENFCRNELFIWLRDADFHGICRSEKSIEAVVSVVDDEGIFLPEAIEIITPEGAIRESSFRCRVWPSSDRPRFNELIKILLPDQEAKNLHLQILFYNKSFVDRKSLYSTGNFSTNSLSAKRESNGPFALAFLHLIRDYVLCHDDEDELFIYRIDRMKGGNSEGNNVTRTIPLSVAYLSNPARRKEAQGITSDVSDEHLFSSSIKSRSSSVATLPSSLDLTLLQQQLNQNVFSSGYILCERNTLHFQSFICSQLHCNNKLLIQILRWRDYCNNENQQINVLKQYLIEFSRSDLYSKDYFNEITKFCHNILDSLFQIADEYPQLQIHVFEALVHLFSYKGECPLMKEKLEEYIKRMFWTRACGFLLENFVRRLRNDENFGHFNKKPSTSSTSNISTHHSFHSNTTMKTTSFTSFVKPETVEEEKQQDERLFCLFRSMDFIVKLAIASNNLKSTYMIPVDYLEESFDNTQSKEQQKFNNQIDSILKAIIQFFGGDGTTDLNTSEIFTQNSLVSTNFNITPKKMRKHRNVLLKHLPSLISPLLENCIYTPLYLASFVKKIVTNISENIISPYKELIPFLGTIINSELFNDFKSRSLLLEQFLDKLLSQLQPLSINRELNQKNILQRRASITAVFEEENQPIENQPEAVELSAKILTDLIERLFPHQKGGNFRQIGTNPELEIILQKTLRPVIQTMVTLLGDPQLQRPLHSLLLAILDKLSAHHFSKYFSKLEHTLNKIDALSEILHMFRDLLSRCPAPKEWSQIRSSQTKIFLKIIRFSSAYLQHEFSSEINFSGQLWLECMHSCVAVIKWACLEKGFSRRKRDVRRTFLNKDCDSQDICEIAAKILLSSWLSLSPDQKIQLMPEMVGPLLELSLCNNSQIRLLIIPIFFDILFTEYFIKNIKTLTITPSDVVLRKTFFQKQTQQQNLNKSLFFEEFVKRLDIALDEAKDDFLFNEFEIAINQTFDDKIITLESEEINAVNVVDSLASITRFFVKSVNKLLDLYSSYLSVLKIELQTSQIEAGLFCTVQLIDFYHEMGQNSLYVIYLYKLYDLHISAGNWVEAAITLQRHFSLLNWTNERPSKYLYGARKQNVIFNTQMALKEYICIEMAKLFEKGQHWELAIETNRELINVYETILFDYGKLSELLKKNAFLYEKIIKELRLECNYFLVAFYGKECPSYLANKKFIFRGQPLESWATFKQRFLAAFSDFKFIESMEISSEELQQSKDKLVQIITVTPIPSPFYSELLLSPSRLTSWYYKYHKVQRFELIRREFKTNTKWTTLEDNETMRLWLHKKIFTIQRPLPDLLNFAQIINEQELIPSHPIEVAIERVKEANDKLADLSSKVAEGFVSEFHMNLGGMIRGIVQADVGGGIKNYQPFFTAQCRVQCSEEENRCIENLMTLILEQVTLLEYSLFIHANNTPTTILSSTSNSANAASFHNSLVASFNSHKCQIETQFGKTSKSLLPEGASIYSKIDQNEMVTKMPTNVTVTNNASNSILTPPSTISSSPTATRAFRSHSISEFQNSQNEGNLSTRNSQISSSSSTNSGSSNFFRNSPIGTAGNLIKSTIQQAKAKQKQRKNLVAVNKRRNTSSAISTKIDENQISKSPQFLRLFSQKHQKQQQISSTIPTFNLNTSRISDCSLENFCFPMDTNAPPLPPRQSNFHSEVLISTKIKGEKIQRN